MIVSFLAIFATFVIIFNGKEHDKFESDMPQLTTVIDLSGEKPNTRYNAIGESFETPQSPDNSNIDYKVGKKHIQSDGTLGPDDIYSNTIPVASIYLRDSNKISQSDVLNPSNINKLYKDGEGILASLDDSAQQDGIYTKIVHTQGILDPMKNKVVRNSLVHKLVNNEEFNTGNQSVTNPQVVKEPLHRVSSGSKFNIEANRSISREETYVRAALITEDRHYKLNMMPNNKIVAVKLKPYSKHRLVYCDTTIVLRGERVGES